MKKLVALFVVAALLVPTMASQAFADNDRGRGRDHERFDDRRDDNNRRWDHNRWYNDRDRGWDHDRHDQRGRWVVSGGVWRWFPAYPTMIYPYPPGVSVVLSPTPPVPLYWNYYNRRPH